MIYLKIKSDKILEAFSNNYRDTFWSKTIRKKLEVYVLINLLNYIIVSLFVHISWVKGGSRLHWDYFIHCLLEFGYYFLRVV